MIAVLDAKPGLADAFRERIVELARQVRREPGCAAFTAYEAGDTPDASTSTRSTRTPPRSTRT
jgi:quinol monooxygenase YgiN